MKTLLFVLALTSAPAFAGTAMVVTNNSLGFNLTQYRQGAVDMDISDKDGNLFEFNHVGSFDTNPITYREVKGLCTLTVETFDKNFASGNTKNEYMLSLMAFVVKVTAGEDKCALKGRSLTGIYL